MNKKIFTIVIIFLFFSINIIQAQNIINNSQKNEISDYKNILIRLNSNQEFDYLLDLEIVSGKPGEYLDILASEQTLQILRLNNIEYQILDKDLDSTFQSSISNYHSFEGIENFLQNTADNFPAITQLSSLGQSYEQRDIWCLEISDNPGVDENEVGVFFMGLHHAREWPTVEICLYVIEKLTSGYGSDPDIKELVDNRRIWIVPCVNPDGYYFSHDLLNDFRKNRHYFPDSDTIGVDLNRNYPGTSNGVIDGAWGTIRGSISIDPRSEVYCGPGPASELETQAVKNVFLENDITACISWHTFGEMVIWPWGYSTSAKTPDDTYLSQVGVEIARRISTSDGSAYYDPFQSAALYPTTGDTTDWAYGYYHYVLGKPLFAYTIEACDTFHPAGGELDQVLKENYDGALYLLEEASNIKDNVIPRVIIPEINSYDAYSNGDYELSWNVLNADSNPEYFQLDEISNLQIFTDNAESDIDNWELNDFVRTNEKSFSGTYSYKSKYKSGRIFSMETKDPVPINNGMKLTFNTWYDLRNNDFVVLEISTNNRSFEVLDKYTCSSNGWVNKQYSLNQYYGKSIYLRFRHSSESGIIGDMGFYVDDISPVADYEDIDMLSDNIYSNSYQVTGRTDGIYYYRARGFNSEHGWGDFCTLKRIQVGATQPNAPDEPTGSTNGVPGTEYTYSTKTNDPQGEQVYYLFDWGDGTDSGWLGPYPSGQTISATHSWQNRGIFVIRVKAKDINEVESDWSEPLSITMPRLRFFENSLLSFLIQRIMVLLKN